MSLDIAVVTNPVRVLGEDIAWVDDPAPYIAVDVNTVKPALLFADRVHLRTYMSDLRVWNHRFVSRSVVMPLQMAFMTLNIARWSPESQKRYMIDPDRLPDSTAAGLWHRQYATALRDGGIDALWDRVDEFERQWPDANAEMDQVAEHAMAWSNRCRFDALEDAVDANVLTISGWSDDIHEDDEQEFMDRTGWDLLDRIASSDELLFTGSGARRTLGVTLGAEKSDLSVTGELLGHLPGFERATIAEILDVRSELKPPLIQFRSAMVQLRREVASLPEAESNRYVRDHFHRTVAPALSDIEDRILSNRYLAQLTDAWLKPGPWMTSAAGVAMAFGPLPGAAEVAAIIAGATWPFAEAARAKKLEAHNISRTDYYIVHRLSRTVEPR